MAHKTWRYDFPSVNGEGWGTIILGSDGYFSVVSDYGNFAYRWSHHAHDDFRRFWLVDRWNWPDYTVSKLTSTMWHQTKTTRAAAEQQCRFFCQRLLPRLAAAIEAELKTDATPAA